MNTNLTGDIVGPDVLIMVGSSFRHRYFATRIAKRFTHSVVLIQDDPPSAASYSAPEVETHLQAFSKVEKSYFQDFVHEHAAFLSDRTVRTVTSETLNSADTIEFIRSMDPRLIVVHSTSIIRRPLIQAFPLRIINLHAGLSPYYRGVATNVFPIVNREPQCIGMTVHFIDEGIDSGPIILQGRPIIEEFDDSHTIGCKNVILGTDLMIKVVDRYLDVGSVPHVKQDQSRGKQYYNRDFTPETVKILYQNIADGLLKSYAFNPVNIDLVYQL